MDVHIRNLIYPWSAAQNLWQHRRLLVQLVKRDLRQRFQGSYLGALWSFITPLLILLVYTFVFSVVLQAQWSQSSPSQTGEYALTLLAGLIPFNVFAEVVNRSPSLILSMPNYVKKVVFPLEIMPVVVLSSAVINSLISVGILLAGTLVYLRIFSLTLFLLPLLYLPLMLLCLGFGWLLASLGVFIRDIGQGIPAVVQMLFFLTPIVYPLNRLPESLQSWVVFINPLATVVIGFRQTLLWNSVPPWGLWALWTAIGGVFAWAGYAWFVKTKNGFADVM